HPLPPAKAAIRRLSAQSLKRVDRLPMLADQQGQVRAADLHLEHVRALLHVDACAHAQVGDRSAHYLASAFNWLDRPLEPPLRGPPGLEIGNRRHPPVTALPQTLLQDLEAHVLDVEARMPPLELLHRSPLGRTHARTIGLDPHRSRPRLVAVRKRRRWALLCDHVRASLPAPT